MLTNVDISKSISKAKFVQKGTLSNYKDILFVVGLSFVFLIITTKSFYDSFNSRNEFQIILYVFGLLSILIISFLLIHYTFKIKQLTKFVGTNYENNLNLVKELIHERQWKIKFSKGNIIVARSTPDISVNWQFTAIFDNNNIYVNSMHLGKNDLISPLFYIGNINETKQFIADFELKIKNTV